MKPGKFYMKKKCKKQREKKLLKQQLNKQEFKEIWMNKEHFQQKKNEEAEMGENLEFSLVIIIVLHFIKMDIPKILK